MIFIFFKHYENLLAVLSTVDVFTNIVMKSLRKSRFHFISLRLQDQILFQCLPNETLKMKQN